jgi:hypothetical protein
MDELWSTLGYDEIAREVAQTLRDSAEVVVIEGPPGTGKSWLAKGIGAMWQSGGGSTIVAEGDVLKSDVALYPLRLAMAGLARGWATMTPALLGLAQAGETLGGTAGIITATVKAISGMRRSRRRVRKIFLGDVEQDILCELERLSKKRPILLIADNLHWWDSRSLEFLGRLRDPRMSEAFPFLAEMRLLAVQTPEPYQSLACPEAHEALLSPSATRSFELGRIHREGFEFVLAALGAGPDLSAKTADVVYAFSGGHLALAGRCADRLGRGDTDWVLAAADSDDFLQKLLTERIRSLGPRGKEAVKVLQIAAVLGLTFRRDELSCACDVVESDTAHLLRYCRDEDVLDLSEQVGRFVHDLYRQYFLSVGEADRVAVHERLADCLRLLRPAEYGLRCLNAQRAELTRDATTFAVQAALQMEREGRGWRGLEPSIRGVIEQSALVDALADFAAALDDVNNYRYPECLAALDRLPRDLPRNLLAEADYLRAMCLMSTRSEDDRAEGRAILEAWADYAEQEPELGIRLSQLLLFGLTHMTNKAAGRALERRIQTTLRDRVSFDASAKDAMYTMDRCCGWLYQPDVALIRTREAATHFAPIEGQTVLRRPLEYYRSLSNYGANLICNSLYSEAHAIHQEIDDLVASYPRGVFPRPDFPRMNALLVKYRLGIVDSAQASELQRRIATSVKFDADPYYAESALAVYLALSERYEEALGIFDRLYVQLTSSRADPEPSMIYLLRANRAATLYVSGDARACQAEWTNLTPVVDRIAYAIRPLLVRRHELLGEVIQAGEFMSPRLFDECLVSPARPAEFGPLWQDFGHGFRMPEVEFWREN